MEELTQQVHRMGQAQQRLQGLSEELDATKRENAALHEELQQHSQHASRMISALQAQLQQLLGAADGGRDQAAELPASLLPGPRFQRVAGEAEATAASRVAGLDYLRGSLGPGVPLGPMERREPPPPHRPLWPLGDPPEASARARQQQLLPGDELEDEAGLPSYAEARARSLGALSELAGQEARPRDLPQVLTARRDPPLPVTRSTVPSTRFAHDHDGRTLAANVATRDGRPVPRMDLPMSLQQADGRRPTYMHPSFMNGPGGPAVPPSFAELVRSTNPADSVSLAVHVAASREVAKPW